MLSVEHTGPNRWPSEKFWGDSDELGNKWVGRVQLCWRPLEPARTVSGSDLNFAKSESVGGSGGSDPRGTLIGCVLANPSPGSGA